MNQQSDEPTNCNVNETSRENKKVVNFDAEKSQNFNKKIVFDNDSELKTIINNNTFEKIEYPMCNGINLDDDSIQLKKENCVH